MTMAPRTRQGGIRTPVLLLALGLLSAACRDSGSLGGAAPAPTERRAASLGIEQRDSTVVLALRLTGFGAVRVASVSAQVDFDTLAMRFVEDASRSDGGIRAVRDARGRIMLAAAHAEGFPEEVVAQLRFVARSAEPTRVLALTVTELHLVDATDARAGLVVSPSATMLRTGGTP
jgi:hypothetical protein